MKTTYLNRSPLSSTLLLAILFSLSACGGGGGDPGPGTGDNHAPVAKAGANQTVGEGELVRLDASASRDADGDTLTYAWTQTAGPAVTLADADSMTPSFQTFDIAHSTALTFELTVGDGDEEATDLVDITVEPMTLDVAIGDIKTLMFNWDSISTADHYRLLENPDGASGYAVHTDDISAATGSVLVNISVHRLNWANASYLLEACLDAACTEIVGSNTVTVVDLLATAAIGYAKASNTGANDWFGIALALSADGNTLAVGALFEDSNATGVNGNQADDSAANAGAVYVFVRDATTGAWTQQAYVKASNSGAGDVFGIALALSADGNTLAVGARSEKSAATGIAGNQADDTTSNAGAVYVFMRSGTDWAQQAYVKASNTGAGDKFGSHLALSADGNTLAVGARGEDSIATGIDGNQADDTASFAGAVYVYTRSGTDWAQQGYVKASNTDAGDQFGIALALSADGDTLAVGALGEDSIATGVGGNQADDTASFAGAVYVFTRSGTDWAQQAYVKASNTGANDQFGSAVALSATGDTLAVGATFESSIATGIDGDQADNTAAIAGAVYVFMRSGTDWAQQAYVKASNTGAIDKFGGALALSATGDTLAVGATSEASTATGIGGDQADGSAADAGAAYVFTRSGTDWAQQAYVKASNTGAGDYFGIALALSATGDTLAVGASFEASTATGIDGDQADDSAANAGAVYVY